MLAAIEDGAVTCDAAAAGSGVSGPDAAAALSRLEALGYVTCSPLGIYPRTLLSAPGGDSI